MYSQTAARLRRCMSPLQDRPNPPLQPTCRIPNLPFVPSQLAFSQFSPSTKSPGRIFSSRLRGNAAQKRHERGLTSAFGVRYESTSKPKSTTQREPENQTETNIGVDTENDLDVRLTQQLARLEKPSAQGDGYIRERRRLQSQFKELAAERSRIHQELGQLLASEQQTLRPLNDLQQEPERPSKAPPHPRGEYRRNAKVLAPLKE